MPKARNDRALLLPASATVRALPGSDATVTGITFEGAHPADFGGDQPWATADFLVVRRSVQPGDFSSWRG